MHKHWTKAKQKGNWFPTKKPSNKAGAGRPPQITQAQKQAIADKAGLVNTNYDGYMKYWKPSLRYKRARQLAFANQILPSDVLDNKRTTSKSSNGRH